MEREIWPHLIKNKTQTAGTNIVSFRIFMNLTFRICYLAVEFGLSRVNSLTERFKRSFINRCLFNFI